MNILSSSVFLFRGSLHESFGLTLTPPPLPPRTPRHRTDGTRKSRKIIEGLPPQLYTRVAAPRAPDTETGRTDGSGPLTGAGEQTTQYITQRRGPDLRRNVYLNARECE